MSKPREQNACWVRFVQEHGCACLPGALELLKQTPHESYYQSVYSIGETKSTVGTEFQVCQHCGSLFEVI